MDGAGWSTEETRTLIILWGQANVQGQLGSVARNRALYKEMARGHAEAGYDRTWQQCRTKIKYLTQRDRKVYDRHCHR